MRSLPQHRRTVETVGPEQTQELAAALGEVARQGDRLALSGPLGAGKTQFAKGFARGVGVTDVVNSPSFTLMAEYEGRLPLFHLDLYRLDGATEALAGGMLDERQDLGVTLVEWPERLGDELDPDRLEVRFTNADGDRRSIELVAADERYARYVERADGWASARLGRGAADALDETRGAPHAAPTVTRG